DDARLQKGAAVPGRADTVTVRPWVAATQAPGASRAGGSRGEASVSAVSSSGLPGLRAAGLMLLLGTATMFFRAGQQSYLPSLVPSRLMPRAFARLEQTMTAAESVGPVLAGGLIRLLSAPAAIAVNALTYACSAIVLATIAQGEAPPQPSRGHRHVLADLREGAAWVYRHRTLAPYAMGLHLWFLGHSLITTLYVFYANQELGLDAFAVGLTLACAGVSGVLAAGLAPRLGLRFGAGRICVVSDWITPLAYLGVLFAPPGGWGVAVLCAAYGVHGVGMGLKGPLEGSYRNAVTPNRLRGRMNATIRTFNWGMLALSGPLAGVMAVTWGNRLTITVGIGVLVLAAVVVTFSPFRRARMPQETEPTAHRPT
ncbi:MAG TPA: MFS transporter, partial [Beutenbergiaceae bacterium]|nr:MFS transporter [Beutenbergiaceae bacterium]